VHTFVYPLATYSPEYQALVWCQENKAKARFMDLPSSVFLGLMDRDDGTTVPAAEKTDKEKDTDADSDDEPGPAVEEKPKRASVYDQIARLAGEPDYETYWERHFEQLHADNTYLNAARSFGEELRSMEDFSTRHAAENLVREAYMRRKIQQAIAEGFRPEQIVVVTGAFHASALGSDLPPMTDDEFAKLRCRNSKMTLMPYSFSSSHRNPATAQAITRRLISKWSGTVSMKTARRSCPRFSSRAWFANSARPEPSAPPRK